MRLSSYLSIKSIMIFLLAGLIFINVRAQKLPDTQQASLPAPNNVKIDGNLNEWDNQLQAYNNNTQIYYSIANSNEYLYLTLQIKEPGIINKVLIGGVTFTINHTGQKADKANMSVTFPLLKKQEVTSIGIKMSESLIAKDSTDYNKQIDSLILLMNNDMQNKAKEIKLLGMKELPDTNISVYNEEGIKAITKFNKQRRLIYELAIPLKYLGLSIINHSNFHYNVMLNGLDQSNVIMHQDGTMVISTPRGIGLKGVNSMSFAYPTDFWGEYTLVD